MKHCFAFLFVVLVCAPMGATKKSDLDKDEAIKEYERFALQELKKSDRTVSEEAKQLVKEMIAGRVNKDKADRITSERIERLL